MSAKLRCEAVQTVRITGRGRVSKSVFWLEVTAKTIGPRGQPEIAIGLESQIEPWLPSKRPKPAAKRGIRRTVSRTSSIDNDRRSPRRQFLSISRDWPSETLIARSGENFSLDDPFHRTRSKQILAI